VKLSILAVGRLKERHWVEACDEYYKRIRKRLPFEEIELRQGADVLTRRPARHELWVLDVKGKAWSSEELAAELERRMREGAQGVAIAIGGAEGLPEEVRAAADVKVSLSKLTLPHRLVRLILAEQLYRALSIIHREPYHK
jgi:23S rRNA (pseudouridine1915-N3)-methyltransferase